MFAPVFKELDFSLLKSKPVIPGPSINMDYRNKKHPSILLITNVIY